MHHIDISEEFGSAQGYVVASDRVQVGNYLAGHSEHAQRIAAWLKDNCQNVAILKNINVDDDHRSAGHGGSLLGDFLAQAQDELTDVIILISDAAESQAEGFKLDAWYEGYGFSGVVATGSGNFMVFPEDMAEKMRLDLFAQVQAIPGKISRCSP